MDTSMPPPALPEKRQAMPVTFGRASKNSIDDGFYAAPIQEIGFDTSKIKQTRFRNSTSEARPDSPSTELYMVHYSALTTAECLDGSTVRSAATSDRFNDEQLGNAVDAAAYKGGGSVLRLYFPPTETSPSHFADVMICDSNVCRAESCRSAMPTQARFSGFQLPKTLPFVHYADCTEDDDGNLEFYPGIVNDNSSGLAIPGETEELDIVFHDGFVKFSVLSRVCMPECRICESWSRKAEKTLANHEQEKKGE